MSSYEVKQSTINEKKRIAEEIDKFLEDFPSLKEDIVDIDCEDCALEYGSIVNYTPTNGVSCENIQAKCHDNKNCKWLKLFEELSKNTTYYGKEITSDELADIFINLTKEKNQAEQDYHNTRKQFEEYKQRVKEAINKVYNSRPNASAELIDFANELDKELYLED